MNVRRFALIAIVLGAATYSALAGAQPVARPATASTTLRWYKGNTHTHTLNSDGDSTPDEVVRWYREHRYQFVVLTDHNCLPDVTALQALHGADEQFLVIKGEEVTSRYDRKPLHINGLDVARKVDAAEGSSSVVDVLQRNVDGIRAADGIPHINHPNFGWAITADELAAVKNNRLFEIFNGHPMVNNLGGSEHPGLEQVWDGILSRGIVLYGIAVDDAHDFKRPWDPTASRPGQGWVVVRAARLEPRAIVEALDRGEFYASTGVELAEYAVTDAAITVAVTPTTFSGYRIQFIGEHGAVLKEVSGPSATYARTGRERYVRAKIIESNGALAWTQPVTPR